jgi:hypothetical protein
VGLVRLFARTVRPDVRLPPPQRCARRHRPRDVAARAWALARSPAGASSIVLLMLITMGDVAQYMQGRGRTYENYAASVEIGRLLPEGTLVHGKLANGLSSKPDPADLRRSRIQELRRPAPARRRATC